MDDLTLSIELDRPPRGYVPGAVITGQLHLDAARALQCNEASVSLLWIASSNDERANDWETGYAARSVAFRGYLEAGKRVSRPFELTVPAAPFSYRGESLQIEWRVASEAQVEGARPYSSHQVVLVEPGTAPPANELERWTQGRAAISSRDGWRGVSIAVGLVFALIGLLTWPAGVIWIAFSALLLLAGSWRSLSALHVGEVELDLPAVLRAGQPFHYTVRLNPRSALRLESITLTLECDELLVGNHKGGKVQRKCGVASHTLELSGPQQLQPRPVTLAGYGVAPETKRYSFIGTWHGIRWSARLRLDVPGYPDWSQLRDVAILPAYQGLPLPQVAETDAEAPLALPGAHESTARLLEPALEPGRVRGLLPAATPSPASEASVPSEAASRGTDELLDALISTPSEPTPAATPPDAPSVEASAADVAAIEQEAPVDQQTYAGSNLVALTETLRRANTLGGERAQLIAALHDSSYKARLSVDHVEWTFRSDLPSRLIGGRTVIGRIDGSQCEIAICAPPSQNDELERLSRGQLAEFELVIRNYDELYQRLVLESRDVDAVGV